MPRQRPPAYLFLDDGWPESRDYDGNYVPVPPELPRPAVGAVDGGDAVRERDRRRVADVPGIWPDREGRPDRSGSARS